MKVFIVFAHPEARSLNHALLRVMIDELEAQGHEVQVSDLYAMKWKSVVDREDFPHLENDARLQLVPTSLQATSSNTLTDDVKLEQEKLMWADIVLFQFPLWWFSLPAILKGWIDRVFSCGFAYGVGAHDDKHWGDRYGEGVFLGKRAMLVATIGGWEEHFSARGVNGPIEDLLFPITHGTLFYAGFQVLPSSVHYRVEGLKDEGFRALTDQVRQKLQQLSTIEPILFRRQNFGAYEIPSMTLKPGLEDQHTTGFALHRAQNIADT